jgi:hypothetical protein
MKEGDQGTKRAGEARENKKRAKDQAPKKCGSKKKGRPEEENFIKKQVSHSIQRAYPLS